MIAGSRIANHLRVDLGLSAVGGGRDTVMGRCRPVIGSVATIQSAGVTIRGRFPAAVVGSVQGVVQVCASQLCGGNRQLPVDGRLLQSSDRIRVGRPQLLLAGPRARVAGLCMEAFSERLVALALLFLAPARPLVALLGELIAIIGVAITVDSSQVAFLRGVLAFAAGTSHAHITTLLLVQ